MTIADLTEVRRRRDEAWLAIKRRQVDHIMLNLDDYHGRLMLWFLERLAAGEYDMRTLRILEAGLLAAPVVRWEMVADLRRQMALLKKPKRRKSKGKVVRLDDYRPDGTAS